MSQEPQLDAELIKPQLPLSSVFGTLALMWAASVYSAYGMSAFPRQEWLLEVLVSLIFVIPVINLLTGKSLPSSAIRWIGVMLMLHSLWDAAHWPGHAWVQTPIDPRIPRYCPWIDLPLGCLLLARGK